MNKTVNYSDQVKSLAILYECFLFKYEVNQQIRLEKVATLYLGKIDLNSYFYIDLFFVFLISGIIFTKETFKQVSFQDESQVLKLLEVMRTKFKFILCHTVLLDVWLKLCITCNSLQSFLEKHNFFLREKYFSQLVIFVMQRRDEMGS